MDLLLDEEESSIKEYARETLAELSTPTLVREVERGETGYSPELWRKIADLDWLGLCLPERLGGQEQPLHYAGLLCEEIGRFIAPIPIHSTLTAALAIAKHGSQSLQEAILPGVARGETILTVAHQEGRYLRGALSTTATRDGDEFVITGRKDFVDNALAAHHMIVSCLDESGTVILLIVETVSAGITQTPLVTIAKDQQSTVQFQAVRVPASALLGSSGTGQIILDELLDLGTVLLCSQMVGATRRDAEMAVEHSKNRVAFGRPIGAFQSIQHLAADMLIAIDGVEMLTREALWRMGAGLPAAVETSQAKSFANEKCAFVCRSSQQIHGGIGFMMEFDLQLWYRRVIAWTLRYGTTGEHRARIASALLDVPGTVRLGMTQLLPEAVMS